MNLGDADKNLPRARSVVVVFDRLALAELVERDRSEILQSKRDYYRKCTQHLVSWIEGRGLSGEVSRIGAPTVFNMLFIDCTLKLAEQLVQAPHVINVFANESFRVDLLERDTGVEVKGQV